MTGKVAFTVARLFKRTLNAVKSDALKKQKITENGITIFTLPLPRQKILNASNGSWKNARRSGLTKLHLLLCDHSERKVIKEERLEKVIISAMKQSLKAYLPRLNPMIEFSCFVKNNQNSLKCIAHCDEGNKKSLQEIYTPGQNATILIGPEGDFSGNEITLALANNFIPVTLGESRLRTETAGIVACHSINFINEINH